MFMATILSHNIFDCRTYRAPPWAPYTFIFCMNRAGRDVLDGYLEMLVTACFLDLPKGKSRRQIAVIGIKRDTENEVVEKKRPK